MTYPITCGSGIRVYKAAVGTVLNGTALCSVVRVGVIGQAVARAANSVRARGTIRDDILTGPARGVRGTLVLVVDGHVVVGSFRALQASPVGRRCWGNGFLVARSAECHSVTACLTRLILEGDSKFTRMLVVLTPNAFIASRAQGNSRTRSSRSSGTIASCRDAIARRLTHRALIVARTAVAAGRLTRLRLRMACSTAATASFVRTRGVATSSTDLTCPVLCLRVFSSNLEAGAARRDLLACRLIGLILILPLSAFHTDAILVGRWRDRLPGPGTADCPRRTNSVAAVGAGSRGKFSLSTLCTGLACLGLAIFEKPAETFTNASLVAHVQVVRGGTGGTAVRAWAIASGTALVAVTTAARGLFVLNTEEVSHINLRDEHACTIDIILTWPSSHSSTHLPSESFANPEQDTHSLSLVPLHVYKSLLLLM